MNNAFKIVLLGSAAAVGTIAAPQFGCAQQAVNVTNTNPNGQATMASSAPVVLPSNQSVGDPCMFQAKISTTISAATATFSVVSGTTATKIYVCSLSLIVPSAVAVSFVEGSTATCSASPGAVIGVSANGTAANGLSFAANGGMTYGNGGGTIAETATSGNTLCILQSTTAQLAGNLTYVRQ